MSDTELTDEYIDNAYNLIHDRTLLVIDSDRIMDKVHKCHDIHVYWGVEPTKDLNIAQLLPLLKLRDLRDIGCFITVLIADVHAHLNNKDVRDIPDSVVYKTNLINILMHRIGLDIEMYNITVGSDIQTHKTYILDLYKFMTLVTVDKAKSAGMHVVKNDDMKVSNLVYPLMQVIDEYMLNADVQIGNIDQKNIFELSREYSTVIGKKQCSYIMHETINANILLSDTDEEIRQKVSELSDVECIKILKHIVHPIFPNVKGTVRSIVENGLCLVIGPIRNDLNEMYGKEV